ncbi:cell filamentation protein Fic [Mangrovactinospora gilvigrisea]|uniref:Cell filamentation protein Fic n=1 Tax=Mangrovactinospora gilvigrisea TaxID=1428644 RepID=A0A1J7C5L2_9ACTN|nr:Fic family protein [Mangrovactinospora gilvigrisea]OIV36840.1 cell filamentation protein Fic [Mangrovactinospora gilvigrisea]
MFLDFAPWPLSWDEVDPARHPFDAASAAETVRGLGPARRVTRSAEICDAGALWADAMSHALVERYGRWAAGWRWSHDEGDFDGGPVGGWCCPRHSITGPKETLDRVAAALCEWRAWLESLAGWFERYPLEPSAVEEQRILWERAARNLILQVVDRTGCGSGWHRHCRQVLTWFLARWGVPDEPAEALVEEAVGGRFGSWTGPGPVLVDDVAERLARSLRPGGFGRPEGPVTDHLERWLALRGAVPWEAGADGPAPAARDGAAEDVRAFDAAIDPARAEGLLAALESARADAARGAVLDFALLAGWQRHVLGTVQPPPFRTAPAFAKGGRERYGLRPGIRARLDACLAESAPGAGRPLALSVRAARACLDVCFFHPFDDGNARAAFLALVFVLAREDAAPGTATPLRRVSWHADAPQDAVALARCVTVAIGHPRKD